VRALSTSESGPYRTLDDAIRDGWWVSFAPGPSWWGVDGQRYHVTAQRREYHVELAGRSLAHLRAAVRMLRDVPLPEGTLPFTRQWWSEQRRSRS
jgi:hypothetical protein